MLWYRAAAEGVSSNLGHIVSGFCACVLYPLIVYSREGVDYGSCSEGQPLLSRVQAPGYQPAILLRSVEIGGYKPFLHVPLH